MSTDEKDQKPVTITEVLDEKTEILEACSNCKTRYRFVVTKRQALRYYPPREEAIQDIFPELPEPARVVLVTQAHACGLCSKHPDENVQEILKPFIVADDEIAEG